MSIGDAFPSDAALQDLIQRPRAPTPQTPKFSTWGMITAAPGGAVAGLSEAAASAAEFAGGMAQNVPSSISGAFGRLPVMSGIQAAIQTGADLTRPRQGQFQNEIGTSLRNVAKDYMPDPVTAHAAEQVVADLFRVGTKAIGAAVTAGPLAGAVVAGAEEGFTTAEKLAGQGVDIATRTKVGLMTGAIQAAGFAMPIAGQTVGQTAGLVALGGPLSFMAQQEATRQILANADYDKLADNYDPFDPVGLALSTLIPAGFGALAMRGARAGLKGEPPKGGPDQETIDAARTALVAENVKTTNPVPVTDFAGSARHEQAYAKAMDQMASGERVNVADVLPENVAVKATEDMRARMEPLVMQMERPEPPQNMIGTLPVIEAKVADLKLSEDVPQFKSGANDKGVVEPLGGSFDRTGVAPIQIWERLDGRQEVISGRHRLDLARRSGEDTIPAQIHREADGFNAVRAASLDAELNIRDGQGKVKDYVQYFEGNQFTREQADARGLLARATGQRAYTIATDGGPELIATHRAGGLGDEAAVAIARIAPNDPRLQAVGLKAVQDGKTISTATNTMQAVRSIARERADTTGDMFGFDDGAMRDAEAMAAIVSRLQRDLSETLAAVQGASKRPEVAKRNGVNIKDPQGLQKRILELQTQKSAWDQWSTNPELVAQIREKMGLEPAPKGEAASAAPPADPPAPMPDQPQDSAGQSGIFDESPASYHEKEATRLEQETPGLMVQLEGMDAPAPLSEVMAKVRQEVTDDLAEAPLIREAANCFLRNL